MQNVLVKDLFLSHSNESSCLDQQNDQGVVSLCVSLWNNAILSGNMADLLMTYSKLKPLPMNTSRTYTQARSPFGYCSNQPTGLARSHVWNTSTLWKLLIVNSNHYCVFCIQVYMASDESQMPSTELSFQLLYKQSIGAGPSKLTCRHS